MNVATVPPRSPPRQHAGLLGALDRLFTIATYYPAGHTLVAEVAAAFTRELQQALDGGTTLGIDVGRGFLVIGGQRLDSSQRGAVRLHELLDRLGVARLEFDAGVTPEDLHRFVTTMQRHKLEADTVQGFHRIQLDDLGPAIRTTRREFKLALAGGDVAFLGARIRAAADAALGALERDDLDAGARAACEQLLETLTAKLAGQMEQGSAQQQGGQAAGVRSFDDVFALAAQALRHALLQTVPATATAADLAGALAQAQLALVQPGDGDMVALMLDAFRQAARQARGSRHAAPPIKHTREAEACEWTVDELNRRLDEAAEGDSGAPAPADRRETLAVLLQIATAAPPPALSAEVLNRLRENVAPPLQPAEHALLATALGDLAARVPLALLDPLLDAVCGALRAGSPSAPGSLLRDAARGLAGEALAALWPHIVNEILAGLEHEEPAVREALHQAAASLDEDAMRRALPRLEGLASLREGKLSLRWLHAPPPGLAPLCALLLWSAQGLAIGAALWEGLRQRPPVWLPGRTLALLGDYQPRHRPLLARVLGDAGAAAPSAETRALWGRLLSEALSMLPPSRRGEAAAADAIAALGLLGGGAAVHVLRAIQSGRRLLVWPAWPARCRLAAGEALLRLQHPAPSPALEGGAGQRGDAS